MLSTIERWHFPDAGRGCMHGAPPTLQRMGLSWLDGKQLSTMYCIGCPSCHLCFCTLYLKPTLSFWAFWKAVLNHFRCRIYLLVYVCISVFFACLEKQVQNDYRAVLSKVLVLITKKWQQVVFICLLNFYPTLRSPNRDFKVADSIET